MRRTIPRFARFPPHCIRGTAGAAIVPETLAHNVLHIPNRAAPELLPRIARFQQVILEKQTLDVFDNPNTEELIERLKTFTDADAEFVVFGVVTEYCVRFAAKGLLERHRRVAVVSDAIETLDAAEGAKTVAELKAIGARMISTDQALALLP